MTGIGPFNITPASILSDVALVGGLLTTLTKTDVVQVLDQQSSAQVFSGARPLKAEVREFARTMEYPIENGATISDHIIFLPTEINLTCVIPSSQYSTAYVAIRNAWKSSTLLAVQTRTGTYRNMYIAEMPHDEDSELYSAITIVIKMKEAIRISAGAGANGTTQLANFSPADPRYSSNIQSGLIAAVNIAGSGLSYLHAATVFGIRI